MFAFVVFVSVFQ